MIVAESLLEHMQVTISEDGTRAFVTPDDLIEISSVTEENLVQLLESQGIAFGIKENLVTSVAEAAGSHTPIPVAEGIKPIPGKDGWLDCLVEVNNVEPLEEKGGLVDLHKLHRIHNVKKGEKLAILHPPIGGVAGMSVRGLPIAAKAGRKAKVIRGPFVALDPDTPDLLLATEDGNLVMKPDGTIEVQPVLTIRGDVDFSTGDIDFVGSLVVTGDVKSDFTVKVQKNLEVRGDVCDATIIAGGNVQIKKGFFGRGKGSISAGGNVTVQHVLNQSITSDMNIAIEREAVCAKIQAGDSIAAPRAKFVGCTLRAGNNVEVFDLGNGDDSRESVHAGRRAELVEQRIAVEKELEQLNKQTVELQEYVFKLVRAQLDAPLTNDQNQLLEKLKRIQGDLPQNVGVLQKKKTDLESAIREAGSARIIAKGTIYVNALVNINGVKKLMQSSLKEVMFVEKDGKLDERPAPSK